MSAWRRWPETCDEEVSRRGESQPCEKPAVAVRLDYSHGSVPTPYPVCSYHARKPMLSLADVIAAVSAGEPKENT